MLTDEAHVCIRERIIIIVTTRGAPFLLEAVTGMTSVDASVTPTRLRALGFVGLDSYRAHKTFSNGHSLKQGFCIFFFSAFLYNVSFRSDSCVVTWSRIMIQKGKYKKAGLFKLLHSQLVLRFWMTHFVFLSLNSPPSTRRRSLVLLAPEVSMGGSGWHQV